MTFMSVLLPRAAMEDALARRGGLIETVDGLLDVLSDAAGSTATLSAGEQAFLTQSGVPADSLAPAAVGEARVALAALAAKTDRQAADGLTTREVAELLGIHGANVRRLLAARDLYAAGKTARGEHTFPPWQFAHSHLLPHLHDVLQALPAAMHPLDVEAFMTEQREPLGGRSPVEWLATGGAPGPVVELATQESWA